MGIYQAETKKAEENVVAEQERIFLAAEAAGEGQKSDEGA